MFVKERERESVFMKERYIESVCKREVESV